MQALSQHNDEIGVLLVGKVGVGKSSVGNQLVGYSAFGERHQLRAGTKQCQEGIVRRDYAMNHLITVVDTPGYLDTEKVADDINQTVLDFLSTEQYKVDVILVVFSLSEEIGIDEIAEIEKNLTEIFHDHVYDYIVNVFTHKRHMIDIYKVKTFSEFIPKMPAEFSSYLKKCGNRYAVLDNKSPEWQDYKLLVQLITLVHSFNKTHYKSLGFNSTSINRIIKTQRSRIQRLENENSEKDGEIERLKEDLRIAETRLKRSKDSTTCSLS